MRPIYSRKHRLSIYEPASIHDIPSELHKHILVYLLPGDHKDLISSCRVNRAWYPIAMEVLSSRASFGKLKASEACICSRLLSSLVFEFVNRISRLNLEVKFMREEILGLMAGIVAPTLSTLSLDFTEVDDGNSSQFETLNIFFEKCDGIRAIRLISFNFSAFNIHNSIKRGFKQIRQLELFKSRGSIVNFMESVPILKLSTFSFESLDETSYTCDLLISLVARMNPSLRDVYLFAPFDSTISLLGLIESCPELASFTLFDYGSLMLSKSDIKAFASLPLTYFDTNCKISADAIPLLSNCKSLRHIVLDIHVDLSKLLPAIGRTLVSLGLVVANVENIDAILRYCPLLEYLSLIREVGGDAFMDRRIERMVCVGLKRLAKLIVDDVAIRLGSDWAGYENDC